MQKKIIALQGISNSGKSKTIKETIKLLKLAFPAHQVIFEKPWVDIITILSINGIKVGVEMHGDTSKRIEETLKLFQSYGCQIVLIATRSRGNTRKAVEKYQDEFEISWVSKKWQPLPEEQPQANLEDANTLLAMISSFLSE